MQTISSTQMLWR